VEVDPRGKSRKSAYQKLPLLSEKEQLPLRQKRSQTRRLRRYELLLLLLRVRQLQERRQLQQVEQHAPFQLPAAALASTPSLTLQRPASPS
jgi:hypothetical protein